MSATSPFCWNCHRVAGETTLHRDGIGSANWICGACEAAIDAVITQGKRACYVTTKNPL